MAEFRMENLREVFASMDALVLAVEQAAVEAVRDGSSLIERYAKQGFAGQHPPGTPRPEPDNPKPYAVTEALKRSIGRDPIEPIQIGLGTYQQSVYPTMVYARRIELGFKGTDSLNRTYNQRAYPYLAPAVKRVKPMLSGLFMAAWRRALRK